MRGDTGVLKRLQAQDKRMDRAAKRMRARQLREQPASDVEQPRLVVRRVQPHAFGRSKTTAAAAGTAAARRVDRAAQELIARRIGAEGRHAFLVGRAADGLVLAPKYATACGWPADVVGGAGCVALWQTALASTDFPLFGAEAGVSLIGVRICAYKGVAVYALCDANAHGLRTPAAFGLDEATYRDVQRASIRMLQLDVEAHGA